MSIYGYLRVSTKEQETDNCKAEILLKVNKLGYSSKIEWIEEKISGTKHWKERELGKLVDRLKKEDIIITSELSRIGRTVNQIFEFISVLTQKEVKLYMTKTDFKVDGSIVSSALISAYAISAQIERELIQSRTLSALQNAREKGIILGRPKGKRNNNLKLDKNKEEIKNKIKNGITLKRIAEDCKVSQNTMCKYVKDNNMK